MSFETNSGRAVESTKFTTMPSSDVKVYAKWIVNSYNIHFVTNGGNAITDITAKYGSDISSINDKQIPVKEGYTFTGWYVDEACTVPYDPDKVYSDKVTLHAGWRLKEYTVKWEDFDGKVIKSEKVAYGKNGSAPVDPERDGYTFTRWSEKSDNIVSNMTIEALYEKITILLSADYEMPDDASSTEITDGDKVSLSEITLYTEKYKKAQFSAKVIGSKLPVRWSSSDTNIASVSKSGKVTVKKAGMVNITATCGGAEATCRVVVKKAAIGLAVKGKESVYKSVGGSSTKMNKSQTYNLKVTAVPNGKVTCKVGNKKILKVSTTKKANVLKIKALKKGNTTLTVELNGIKRKIKVKVKK